MKGFKKYIPIALLVASFGLGFNVGCDRRPREESEQIVNKGQVERHIVGDKEYVFGDIRYWEFANKGFSIDLRAKISDKEKLVKNFRVDYTCYTDEKGEFILDSLTFLCTDSLSYLISISGYKESSELKAKRITITNRDTVRDIKEDIVLKDVSEEEKKYLDFGTKQLNLYNKLLNIEEKRKNSKGRNIYHIPKYFDISKLSAYDLDLKDGELKAYLKPIEISIYDENSRSIFLEYDHPKIMMTIFDANKDGKADVVRLSDGGILNFTQFRKNNGNYEYIEDIYTEDQVKAIFTDANQKLELINKAIKDWQTKKEEKGEEKREKEKKTDFEEILKELE